MPSYAQWRVSADKGHVARVTWLCGDQSVLVEEVVEQTKKSLQVTEFDYISLSGEEDSVEIWDAAYQYSLDPNANRLVLVRDADEVQDWRPLKKWFQDSRKLTSNYILFVSSRPDYPMSEESGMLLDHVDLIRSKGKTVRCCMPSSGELINWIMRNSSFGPESAKFLLDRCGGDLNVISNICKKSVMFNEDPGRSVISTLTSIAPAQSFADSLLNMRKQEALSSLLDLVEDEYAKIIGLLYSRLDLLQVLHKAAPNFSTIKELSAATGVKIFLIQKYGSLAKSYDRMKIDRCRNLLTVVDDAVQRRAYDGALELLVHLW